MTDAARIGIGFVWILASVITGYFNKSRSTGFLTGFLLSFFLSPVAGILAYMLSRPKIIEKESEVANDYYLCSLCGNVEDYNFQFCPACGKDYLGRTREEVPELEDSDN